METRYPVLPKKPEQGVRSRGQRTIVHSQGAFCYKQTSQHNPDIYNNSVLDYVKNCRGEITGDSECSGFDKSIRHQTPLKTADGYFNRREPDIKD